MALVFAGICSHGPGITGRAERADPALRDPFYAALDSLRADIEASEAEALVWGKNMKALLKTLIG